MTTGGQTLKHFLAPSLQTTSHTKTKQVVVIMDEVDGLSSGDRGGAQALGKLIETTMCPIICICNDRMHPKVTTALCATAHCRFFF